MTINLDDLKINPISENDDFTKCDFTKEDGSDPLRIDYFIHKNALRFKEDNIALTYVVKYNEQIVAYYAVSMGRIKVDNLAPNERIKGATKIPYPALLLGRIGTEKKFRNHGIASKLCTICFGLAIDLGKRVGCRYIHLHTCPDQVPFYQKRNFVPSELPDENGKILMYRRIPKRIVRGVHESMHLHESVSIKVTRAKKDEEQQNNHSTNQSD